MGPCKLPISIFLCVAMAVAAFAGDDELAKDLYGDGLPAGTIDRMGTVRFRQGTCIRQFEWCASANVLALFGADGMLRLWDDQTGKELRAIFLGQSISRWAMSPNAEYLAIIGRKDWTIEIWDVATAKRMHLIERETGVFMGLAFSPDSQILAATGRSDQDVKLIEVASGKEQKQISEALPKLDTFRGEMWFSPDGSALAIPGEPSRAREDALNIIDLRSDKIRVIPLGFDRMRRAVCSPDHKTFAVLSGNDVHVRKLDDGKELSKFEGIGALSLTYSPDGKYLAAYDLEEGACTWEIATGKQYAPDTLAGIRIRHAALSRDGSRLAFADDDTAIRVVDSKTGKDAFDFVGHTRSVWGLALSSDNRLLATMGNDGTFRLWDMRTSKQIRSIPSPRAGAYRAEQTAAFSVDGKHLAVARQYAGLSLFDVATGEEEWFITDPENKYRDPYINRVQFLNGDKLLAVAYSDGNVRFLNKKSGREVQRYPETIVDPAQRRQYWEFHRTAFSADGKLMYLLENLENVCGGAGLLRVIELATGKQRRAIQIKQIDRTYEHVKNEVSMRAREDSLLPHEAEKDAMCISPDGRYMAWTALRTIRLVDLSKGKEVRQYGAGVHWLGPTAFSPDGKTLAAGASDGTIRFWEVATGTLLGALKGHRGSINCLTYSNDGKLLVTGSEDTTVLVWEVAQVMSALRSDGADEDAIEGNSWFHRFGYFLVGSAGVAVMAWLFANQPRLRSIWKSGLLKLKSQ